MKAVPPAGITLPQFTAAFVPFGIFAVSALLWPETTQALDLERTKATIWATSILLIPALVLYPFRMASAPVANLAHLYWTFAYLLFLIHAYWAVFVIFDGIVDTFKQMGAATAGANFLLVLWVGHRRGPPLDRAQRHFTHGAIPMGHARLRLSRVRYHLDRVTRRACTHAWLRVHRGGCARARGPFLGPSPAGRKLCLDRIRGGRRAVASTGRGDVMNDQTTRHTPVSRIS
jgi:hypothetical protein